MSDKALPVPFEASEVIDILCDEFRARLGANCHLQGRREWVSFKAHFDIGITLRSVAGVVVDTVVWAKPYRDPKEETEEGETVLASIPPSDYVSGEPNAERMKRGMPLTVTDKRGNKRKVRVTDAEAVSSSKVSDDDGA